MVEPDQNVDVYFIVIPVVPLPINLLVFSSVDINGAAEVAALRFEEMLPSDWLEAFYAEIPFEFVFRNGQIGIICFLSFLEHIEQKTSSIVSLVEKVAGIQLGELAPHYEEYLKQSVLNVVYETND